MNYFRLNARKTHRQAGVLIITPTRLSRERRLQPPRVHAWRCFGSTCARQEREDNEAKGEPSFHTAAFKSEIAAFWQELFCLMRTL
jgi:hypothetical protein